MKQKKYKQFKTKAGLSMKRFLFISLLVLLSVCLIISCCSAGEEERFTDEATGLTYRVKDGIAYVTGSKPVGTLVIPSEIGGYRVYGIDSFFADQELMKCLKELIVEDGVATIGTSAFQVCTELKKVTLPDSITSIESEAFYYCQSLSEIKMPAAITLKQIGGSAFRHVMMSDIILEDGTSLLHDADPNHPVFSGWSDDWYFCKKADGTVAIDGYSRLKQLRNLIIPEELEGMKVTEICDFIFHGVVMDKVTLPESMEVIGKSAFAECSCLTEINLPASLKEIGPLAFAGIAGDEPALPKGTKIPEIIPWYWKGVYRDHTHLFQYGILPDGTAVISSMNLSHQPDTVIPETVDDIPVSGIFLTDYSSHDNLKTLKISEGIRYIGDETFFMCPQLSEVTLPSTLKYIGASAFAYCENLTAINLPEGLEIIGDNAFNQCQIKQIRFPSTLREIGKRAFFHNGITSLKIPDTVVKIGEGAFSGGKFTSLTLPQGITEVPEEMCAGNMKLKSITVPENIIRIGDYAFRDCGSLSQITLTEGLESIGDGAFANEPSYANTKKPYSSLKSIKLPASLRKIGKDAFRACDSLTGVTFANNSLLTEIGANAFEKCYKLKEIKLPDSLTSIGSNAFLQNIHLAKADLGSSVTNIGDEAFSGCNALTSLIVPDSLTQIGERILDGHGTKLTVTCSENSAMDQYIRDHLLNVKIQYSN